MSVRETSEALDITESNVKVRFIRAKSMLHQEIRKVYSPGEIFEFNLIYCDKMVERVMHAIRALG
jgi:RNA polymerase sigma-70 factor (ECF subfamily)